MWPEGKQKLTQMLGPLPLRWEPQIEFLPLVQPSPGCCSHFRSKPPHGGALSLFSLCVTLAFKHIHAYMHRHTHIHAHPHTYTFPGTSLVIHSTLLPSFPLEDRCLYQLLWKEPYLHPVLCERHTSPPSSKDAHIINPDSFYYIIIRHWGIKIASHMTLN